MFRDPAGATAAVCKFLELPPHQLEWDTPYLQRPYDRSISPDLREKLLAYFEPYNRELYRWLGQEFDWS